ncbi:PREDICTED: glutathione S-transferase T3-like [Brassica oleracea var. oleracea]|uniref:glutathione S-transferase T3-like n=1 Tax=Brassica oleracea var. oleracea TaxID=109376 RepID=UPI0006A6F8DC|nr:PREDICTED: glutathione S-transferase T3-like [Brassica oleracea var. oleracea]
MELSSTAMELYLGGDEALSRWRRSSNGGSPRIKSKDAVVGNEQKAVAFCKRIADYIAASPKLAGCEKRDPMHCKHRWHKISDLELRHDQKWCDLSTDRTSKKRKGEDGAQSSTSHATGEAEEGTARPPGVKAAKSRGKKPVEGKGFCEFERVWNVRQEDLSRRERLTKMGLLDRLLAKTEPLPEYEECLKKKLINEMFMLCFSNENDELFVVLFMWKWSHGVLYL